MRNYFFFPGKKKHAGFFGNRKGGESAPCLSYPLEIDEMAHKKKPYLAVGEGDVVFEYAWLGECFPTGLGASGDHVVLLPDLHSLDHLHAPLPSPFSTANEEPQHQRKKILFFFFSPLLA